MTQPNFGAMNALALAFVGDAEYSLRVRKMLANRTQSQVNRLHQNAVRYVCAAAQATAMAELLPLLTEQETAVFKRGRNAHTTHTPKGATEAQYHAATGFEALFGYLSLTEQTERLDRLFCVAINAIEKA